LGWARTAFPPYTTGEAAQLYFYGARGQNKAVCFIKTPGGWVGVYLLTARRPNTFARSLISCAARHTIGCRAVLAAAICSHMPFSHTPTLYQTQVQCGAHCPSERAHCFWHLSAPFSIKTLQLMCAGPPEVIFRENSAHCARALCQHQHFGLAGKERRCFV
jgi:hypothetical protein